jgi:hypothetical protein
MADTENAYFLRNILFSLGLLRNIFLILMENFWIEILFYFIGKKNAKNLCMKEAYSENSDP